MDYFIMKTDKRIFHVANVQLPSAMLFPEGEKEKNPLSGNEIVYINESSGLKYEYPDFIEKPYALIAEKYEKIFSKYQSNMRMQKVTLIEKKSNHQKNYLYIEPPIVDGDVGNNRIFCFQEKKNEIIVRLDVAESILRREANGIWFEPIEIGVE